MQYLSWWHFSIPAISQQLLTWFWPNLKVGTWEHLDQILTVTVTFVQATFGMTKFVHIRNISAVIDPLLTTLFRPNIFSRWYVFWPKCFLDQTFSWTKHFFEPHFLNYIFWGHIFFCTKNFGLLISQLHDISKIYFCSPEEAIDPTPSMKYVQAV